jgi:hypothetical protein
VFGRDGKISASRCKGAIKVLSSKLFTLEIKINNKDKQLKKLLQLKRFEMPSKERWVDFDYAFENKRLSAIKQSKVKTIFSSLAAIFNFRRVVCASGLCLLLLVAVLKEKTTINNSHMAQ